MLLLPRILNLGILLLQLFAESSAVEPAKISTVRSYKLEFFEGGKSWEQAQKACGERDSWLVEIEDEEIFNAVMKLKEHHIIWIGAHYKAGWAWSGGNPIRYESWKSRSPSTVGSVYNNYCGMMQDVGSWINIDCSKGYRYICQSDMTYPGSYNVTFAGNDLKSFVDAKEACTKIDDSRLVDIKTSGLNSFIKHAISIQQIQYWTSGNDKVREGEWKWGDENPINISSINWITPSGGSREPNGRSGENCLATNYKGWSDEACEESKGYICQKDMTSGQCIENVCSNGGTCEISNTRFICTCEPGYFGITCEKDLITISVEPKNVALKTGETVKATLKVKSYDGNVAVSYKGNTNDLVTKDIIFSSAGSSMTQQIYLGVQLESVTYFFHARPKSNPSKYVRSSAAIKITVSGHCTSSPCMNGGTCGEAQTNPYYTCACTLEYEGLRCEGNRSFVTHGNCKYYMKNNSVINSETATAICKKLGGSLAMIKTRQIQNVLQQQIAAKFGDATDELWAGGRRDGQVWYWMDGTEINFASPRQDPSEAQHQYLTIRLPSSGGIRWISKTESDTANGYICEIPVQDPCSFINCINGGNCVVVGCQGNCNCTPGYYGDLCQRDRILIRADHPIYTTTQDRRTAVSFRITSNHGPVKIEKYKDSISAEALETKRNITDSATFTIDPMVNQTEGLPYIFKATPESDPGSYYKFTCVIVIVQDFISASPEPNTEYNVSSKHLVNGTNMTSSARDYTTSSLGYDTTIHEIETSQDPYTSKPATVANKSESPIPATTFQLSASHVVYIVLGFLLLISLTANAIQALKLRNIRERRASKKENFQGDDDRSVKPYETTFIGSTAHHYENADTTDRIEKESRTEKGTPSVEDQNPYEIAQCELEAQSPTYEMPSAPQVITSSPYEEIRP